MPPSRYAPVSLCPRLAMPQIGTKKLRKQEGTAYTHMFLFNQSLSPEREKKMKFSNRELRQLLSFFLLEIKRASIRQTHKSSFKANFGWQR